VNDQADTQKPNTMDNPFGITKEDVLNQTFNVKIKKH